MCRCGGTFSDEDSLSVAWNSGLIIMGYFFVGELKGKIRPNVKNCYMYSTISATGFCLNREGVKAVTTVE